MQDAISHITFGESFEQLSAETRHVETQIAFPKTFTPGSQDTTGSITMEGRHPIAGHMEVLFNVSLHASLTPSALPFLVSLTSLRSRASCTLAVAFLWHPPRPAPSTAAPSSVVSARVLGDARLGGRQDHRIEGEDQEWRGGRYRAVGGQ